MSWLVDTDVLSQAAKSQPDRKVVTWLEAEFQNCYTSSIVIGQIAYWVRSKEGAQRLKLQRWLGYLVEALEGRICGFNVSVAHVWAEQQHKLAKAGVTMPAEDSMIAATAVRHGLTIVTGNERHFRRPGIKFFNPFKA
jgi:predicted nucleic acid-binding protein